MRMMGSDYHTLFAYNVELKKYGIINMDTMLATVHILTLHIISTIFQLRWKHIHHSYVHAHIYKRNLKRIHRVSMRFESRTLSCAPCFCCCSGCLHYCLYKYNMLLPYHRPKQYYSRSLAPVA